MNLKIAGNQETCTRTTHVAVTLGEGVNCPIFRLLARLTGPTTATDPESYNHWMSGGEVDVVSDILCAIQACISEALVPVSDVKHGWKCLEPAS